MAARTEQVTLVSDLTVPLTDSEIAEMLKQVLTT